LEKYDVIVVGAGTAGCLTATTIAKAGLETVLIDRKAREEIGRKVCGDAVGKHHFDHLGLEPPKGNQLERVMEGVRIFSPDMETVFDVKGEGLSGFLLNRHMFGQRLLKDAVDTGAELRDSMQAMEPIIENGYVRGVKAKDLKTETEVNLFGKVLVEASGFPAIIRKKLPTEMGIDTEVKNEDVEACYREIRELKKPFEDPELCQIYLTEKICPGGYYWIFPKSGTKVNVGLGVAMTGNFPNPKDTLYKHVLSQPIFKDSTVVEGGAWYVPTRRPLDNMVGNSIVIVGDAACQVNPIHGGGIGPSMKGGSIAGETIIEALEKGDVSRGGLWAYNVRYMESYGLKQAGLDVFRSLLQECDDEELNYGMQYKLITEDDLLQTSLGKQVKLNITEKAVRVSRGIRKVGFLKKLNDAVKRMEKVREWYRDYPLSPEGFEKWKHKTKALFESSKPKRRR
jgi:digeranylgeranylglycerophospholipid reductase